MPDPFSGFADQPIGPARRCFAVVPHDVDELTRVPKAIYVGTGGDLALRAVDDAEDVIFRNVPDGATLDVRARYVRAAGTTAADLVALG